MPAIAVEALRRHRTTQVEERLQAGVNWQDHDLVFANESGSFASQWTVRRSFQRLLQRANLPAVRIHDLRHAAATLMLSRNVNPKVVAEMLGHSQVGVTLNIYSHVTPTMQRQAADVVDAVLQA